MLLVWSLAACVAQPIPQAPPVLTSDTELAETGATTPVVEIPALADALGDCGGTFVTPPSHPNQLLPGRDLHRLILDDPAAVCNDGTPAVLYVRAATDPEHLDDWVLHLQGGSHCTTYEECQVRWCGSGYYDASKMSSTWTPETIGGAGIYLPNASQNKFAGYNHAVFYYCSSDVWQGQSGATLTGVDGAQLRVERRGHLILEAGIAALESGATSDSGEQALPSILDASTVLFTGTSGGSVGAQMHLDWLRARWPDPIGLVGVFDAAISPDPSTVSQAVADKLDADAAAEQAHLTADGDLPLFAEESCVAGVPEADRWQCANSTRLPYRWVDTPFLARMDLEDGPTGGAYAAAGATPAEFSNGVAASLALIAARSVDGRLAGAYGPACGAHIGLEEDAWFFRHPVATAEGPVTLEMAVSRYQGGQDVSVIDAAHTASECR